MDKYTGRYIVYRYVDRYTRTHTKVLQTSWFQHIGQDLEGSRVCSQVLSSHPNFIATGWCSVLGAQPTSPSSQPWPFPLFCWLPPLRVEAQTPALCPVFPTTQSPRALKPEGIWPEANAVWW